MQQTPTIDPEFRSLIPPLSAEELSQLEANIRAEGCRDALVTWGHILLDGHNRLEICTQLEIPFDTRAIDLPDRDAAVTWIITNQLGRRNLTAFVRAELALKLKPAIEKHAKENLSAGGTIGAEITNRGSQISAKAVTPIDTRQELARRAGVSHDTISKVEKILAQSDEQTKTLLRAGEISVNAAAQRLEKEQKAQLRLEQRRVQQEPELPEGKFDVLYADPPWKYDFAPHKDGMSIEEHYETLSTDSICDMELPVADNSVLFLWATAPKLLEALQVMKAWGFMYKTCAVWDKQKIAARGAWKSGYWFLGQHELLLVGTRGQFSPPPADLRISSVISEPRTRHSKKPQKAREIIDSYFPANVFRRLEVFAREKQPGWTFWGNEI